jgi:hypothetical protein
MASWIKACAADGIADKDVGRSDWTTGAIDGAPLWSNLGNCPMEVEGGNVFIDYGGAWG